MVTTLYGLQNETFKTAVAYATTAALPAYTATPTTLIAIIDGALPAVDGVGVSAGDRVLVQNETGAKQPNNGIWVVTQTGSVSLPWILTRAPDMTTGGQFPGAAVLVEQGTVHGGVIFCIQSAGPFTPGTTNVTWTVLAGASGLSNPMSGQGDLISSGAGGTPQRIAGDTSNVRKFLRGLSVSGVAQVPAWDTLTAGDIPQLAAYAPTGLTGATAASRYVGATASGHPTTGTFTVGDFVIDRTGTMWVCTSSGSPGTWVQPAGSGLTNPMTAQWDLVVGGTGGAPARLALGANGQVLGVLSGGIAWVNNPAGFSNPMSAAGDLIYGGSGGSAARLGAGSPGQALAVNAAGTAPAWVPTVLNVRAFGAVGNGTTDDTPAIAAALTAAAGGGTVYLPAGTYKTTGQLTVPYNAVMQGDGPQTVIAPTVTGNAVWWHHTLAATSSNYHDYVGGTIRDLTIDGTSASANSIGLHWGDAWGMRIERVIVQNFTGSGCVGAYCLNAYSWTEKGHFDLTLINCSVLGVLDGGGLSSVSGSMEYGTWDFDLYAAANQAGIVITGGAYLTGARRFAMVGNFAGNGSGPALTLTGLGGSGSVYSKIGSARVLITLETAATSSPPQTINFGSSSNKISNCVGVLEFGGNSWTASNAVAANLSFGGSIQHDSALLAANSAPAGWPANTATPISGPSGSQTTVWQLPDQSLLVLPLSFYALSGDDATWINYAFGLCSQPASSASSRTPGPSIVRLVNGDAYQISSTITIPLSCYLDLNTSVLFATASLPQDLIYFHGGAGTYRQQQFQPGGIFNGTIDGTSAVAGCRGVNYGDGQDFELGIGGRLRVEHFNKTGSIGLYEYNQFHDSEKMRVNVNFFDNTTSLVLDVNNPGGAGTSHEYNQYDLHLSVEQHQNGIALINDAWIGRGVMHIYGNCFVGGASPDIPPPILLNLSDPSGVSLQNCKLDIQMETTQSGTYTWQTIKFGSAGSIHNCTGILSFADANWANSDVSGGQLSFGGPIGGDSALVSAATAPGGWV